MTKLDFDLKTFAKYTIKQKPYLIPWLGLVLITCLTFALFVHSYQPAVLELDTAQKTQAEVRQNLIALKRQLQINDLNKSQLQTLRPTLSRLSNDCARVSFDAILQNKAMTSGLELFSGAAQNTTREVLKAQNSTDPKIALEHEKRSLNLTGSYAQLINFLTSINSNQGLSSKEESGVFTIETLRITTAKTNGRLNTRYVDPQLRINLVVARFCQSKVF